MSVHVRVGVAMPPYEIEVTGIAQTAGAVAEYSLMVSSKQAWKVLSTNNIGFDATVEGCARRTA